MPEGGLLTFEEREGWHRQTPVAPNILNKTAVAIQFNPSAMADLVSGDRDTAHCYAVPESDSPRLVIQIKQKFAR